MFYIEKNDKPNFLEKKLNIIKVNQDTIVLPIADNTKEKTIEKLASKTNKIIQKKSNSKKVVLSKKIKLEEKYINFLQSYGIEIQNGKWLFEILLPEIVDYIIKKKKMKKIRVSFLINDLNEVELENIKILAQKFKTINIVTNHIEKFKKIVEKMQENEGIIITLTNNKKKSLMKSHIIINVDFPQELINKYNIIEDAIIINLKTKTKITKKRFNGLNISDYEIDYREDKKNSKSLTKQYYLKDIYESQLYKKQRIKDARNKIKADKVIIKNLYVKNGAL